MNRRYWEEMIERCRVVEPMPKACGDCAVACGFYAEYAEALAEQPAEIREAVLERWFCHNSPSHSCRGARNFIEEALGDA